MTKTFRTAFLWFRSDNRKSAIQNPKWVGIFAIALTFVFGGVEARAQQPGKIPTIGFIRRGSPTDPEVEAFRQGLRELGYVEGKNIIIEFRNTDGKTDGFSAVAAELVRLKVDIIVAAGGSAVVLAVKPATYTIPIVMTNPGDPVAIGVVASLARPGGNITGLTSFSTDLSGKRLELLKEAVPNLSSVAVLWSPAEAGNARNFKETEITAQSLGLKLVSLGLRTARISTTPCSLQQGSGLARSS